MTLVHSENKKEKGDESASSQGNSSVAGVNKMKKASTGGSSEKIVKEKETIAKVKETAEREKVCLPLTESALRMHTSSNNLTNNQFEASNPAFDPVFIDDFLERNKAVKKRRKKVGSKKLSRHGSESGEEEVEVPRARARARAQQTPAHAPPPGPLCEKETTYLSWLSIW